MDAMAPGYVRHSGWRMRIAGCVLGALALGLPACTWDGNFNLLGYTTKAQYDRRYKTIRVPILTNKTFAVVTPIPGLEMNLTEEIVRKIQERTPYQIVGANEPADTELRGTVIGYTKAIINYNQNYETRETEVTLVCMIDWVDLHTGKSIIRLGRRAFDPFLPDPVSPIGTTTLNQMYNQTPIAATPMQTANESLNSPQWANNLGTPGTAGNVAAAPLPTAPGGAAAQGVVIRSTSYFRVELGQSLSTSLTEAYQNMGVKVTEMMEHPW